MSLRPAALAAGPPLLEAHGFESTHAGRRTVHLVTNGTSVPPRPHACVAYRAGQAHAPDACSWEALGEEAWKAHATWTGKGPAGRATVVAFDAEGRPVAWRDGNRTTADPWWATE